MEGLITLVCRNPDHLGEPEAVSNSITVVGKAWAYCRSGAGEKHDWRATVGTTVEALERPRASEERVASQ